MEMSKLEKVIKEFEHLLNAAKGNYQDFVDLTVDGGEEILALLKEQEESVPLKPLCKWLAGYAAPPGDTSWLPMFGSLEKAWEHELKELFTS